MRAVEPMVRLFELGFEHLELRFEGSLLYDDMGPKEASTERIGALESAGRSAERSPRSGSSPPGAETLTGHRRRRPPVSAGPLSDRAARGRFCLG